MTEHRRKREVQIERYRVLKQEVTDPLAAGLLQCVIEELEAALHEDQGVRGGTSCPPLPVG
jgi:hypothetical protein